MIDATCPGCGVTIGLPDNYRGRFRCIACKTVGQTVGEPVDPAHVLTMGDRSPEAGGKKQSTGELPPSESLFGDSAKGCLGYIAMFAGFVAYKGIALAFNISATNPWLLLGICVCYGAAWYFLRSPKSP